MIEQLLTRPVVILYSTTSDELNHETGAKATETLWIESVGYVEPKRTTEPSNHPDIADSDWDGYFKTADLDYLDSASQVWVPGQGVFDVIGQPGLWTDPLTESDLYIEADLKRIAGPDDDRSLL